MSLSKFLPTKTVESLPNTRGKSVENTLITWKILGIARRLHLNVIQERLTSFFALENNLVAADALDFRIVKVAKTWWCAMLSILFIRFSMPTCWRLHLRLFLFLLHLYILFKINDKRDILKMRRSFHIIFILNENIPNF